MEVPNEIFLPRPHLASSAAPIGNPVHGPQIQMSKNITWVEGEGIECNWTWTTWRITDSIASQLAP